MKRLVIVRHAKSSWEQSELADIDRPLNKRGIRNAPEMGRRLAARKIVPNLIISSPAVRALATAKMIAAEVGYREGRIVVEKTLYGAGVQLFLEALARWGDKDNPADLVMLFSHNPGVTELANFLTGKRIDNLPTCGVVIVDFETDRWEGIEKGSGRFIDFDYPKK